MPKWKIRLLIALRITLTAAALTATFVIGWAAKRFASSTILSLAFGLGMVVFGLATLVLLTSLLQLWAHSIQFPGDPVRRAGGVPEPRPSGSAASSPAAAKVKLAAVREYVETISDGHWKLNLCFEISNANAHPVQVYDIRFHTYCVDKGPPLMAIGAVDSANVYESNSIMDDGQRFQVPPRGAIELCVGPEVTRTPATMQLTVVFGVFAFVAMEDGEGPNQFRIPCDSIFTFQNGLGGHLVRLNSKNLPLYKKKHEDSLAGSIFVASCERALSKQLSS